MLRLLYWIAAFWIVWKIVQRLTNPISPKGGQKREERAKTKAPRSFDNVQDAEFTDITSEEDKK